MEEREHGEVRWPGWFLAGCLAKEYKRKVFSYGKGKERRLILLPPDPEATPVKHWHRVWPFPGVRPLSCFLLGSGILLGSQIWEIEWKGHSPGSHAITPITKKDLNQPREVDFYHDGLNVLATWNWETETRLNYLEWSSNDATWHWELRHLPDTESTEQYETFRKALLAKMPEGTYLEEEFPKPGELFLRLIKKDSP